MQPTPLPSPPAPARSLAPVAFASASLALVATLAGPPALAAPFDELSGAARDAVVSACLPVQYRDGAEAYRRCVERETDARATREPRALDLLELDERYAVERRCAPDRGSEIAWLECVDAEIASLAAAPVPGLQGLREDERDALLRDCFEDQSSAGVAAWRECVARAADALRAVPSADLSGLGVLERNALLAGCADAGDAPAYRRCLLERGAVAGVSERRSETSPDAASYAPPSDGGSAPITSAVASSAVPGGGVGGNGGGDVGTPSRESLALGLPASAGPALGAARPDVPPRRVIPPPLDAGLDAPAAGRPEAQTAPAGDDSAEAFGDGAEGDGADPLDPPGVGTGTDEPGLVARLGGAYGALDDSGRLLLWGALALPLLLFASSALMRRRASGARSARADRGGDPDRGGPEALAERIGPTRGRPVGRSLPRYDLDATYDATDATYDVTRDVRDASGRHAPGVAPAPPGPTARVRDRLHEEADDLFDALDRDLDAGEDPDEGFADDDPDAFGPHGPDDADLDETPATVRLDATVPTDLPVLAGDDAGGAGGVARGPDRDAPTRLVATPHAVDDASDVELAAAGRASRPGPAAAARAPRPREGFGAWLASRPEEARRGLAVEFLIYWMAWGDERYEPATRDAVFASDDPDDSTIVKRRVLEEDVDAFAATVRWLVLNASREARSQTLELLVALLVDGPVPTPVQNTLLRFLADAFGLGAGALEAQFEDAFDARLPPLPRVDRPDWWAGQDEAGLVRREARTLARAPEAVRHRATLGLPFDGPLDEDDVLEAFELASRRAAPERFDALGERERQLAARRLDRFADAREALLGEDA